MGRADAGSTKAIANAIKSKANVQALEDYAGTVKYAKKCRDENGFQAHCRSEPHLRKVIQLGPNAGSTIAEFSRQFQYEFVSLLKTRHNTKRVRANAVYNEYIQDKHHVHMNATRWVTLSGFIMTLGKAGIVKVDEDEKGLWISWVDNTPATLAKHAALQKKERAQMDGEERERKVLEDQIARARALAGADETPAKGLEREEGQKISLNLFAKPSDSGSSTPGESSTAAAAAGPSAGADAPKLSFGFGGIGAPKPASTPAVNPLKRPAPTNVFKAAAKSARTDKTEDDQPPAPRKFMSEAERLMKEDQARRAARQSKGQSKGYQGEGPRRGGR